LLYATPEAGAPLEILAFSTVALAAFQLSSAGLQGIGHPQIAMRSLILTGILKTIFNYSLTSIPLLNIRGAALGTLAAFVCGALFNIYCLQRLTGVSYETGRMLKLLLITALMGIAAKVSYGFLLAYGLGSSWSTLLAILAGVAIYGGLLLLFKEFDLDMIKKIAR
ncbi:MAG: stage sporulation protein, partial [Chloroflexi bacterium]|nr:stage sporulation protein [Chloroflexota bacterium]